MALRVLLADESSTIKRVMQLALQDYAVEVKAVPVGLDVLPVAKTFKPDIVFADVLLTKRNGYEVCHDIKADTETQNLPVVLMWSGFMEIDESKISLADARLEKPFDADTLRQLVQNLVPKTKENPISSYLQFPKMPEFTEPTAAKTGVQKSNGKIPEAAPVNFDTFDPNAVEEESIFQIPEVSTNSEITTAAMPEVATIEATPEPLLVDSEEEFTSVPLKSSQHRDQHEEDGWTQQDLKKFKIQLPEEKPEDDFARKFVIPQEELASAHVEDDGEFEELHFGEELTATRVAPLPDSYKEDLKRLQSDALEKAQTKASPKHPPTTPPPSGTGADLEMIERVIREEAREVIENICWKVLPEIAERIVREEINKILRDVEKSV